MDSPPPQFESALARKLIGYAKTAGRVIVENVLTLSHTLRDPDTPLWARGAILSALAYFISPLDLIPDLIPGVGYTDDFTAIAACVAAVAMHVKKEHREQARLQAEKWFGTQPPTPS